MGLGDSNIRNSCTGFEQTCWGSVLLLWIVNLSKLIKDVLTDLGPSHNRINSWCIHCAWVINNVLELNPLPACFHALLVTLSLTLNHLLLPGNPKLHIQLMLWACECWWEEGKHRREMQERNMGEENRRQVWEMITGDTSIGKNKGEEEQASSREQARTRSAQTCQERAQCLCWQMHVPFSSSWMGTSSLATSFDLLVWLCSVFSSSLCLSSLPLS